MSLSLLVSFFLLFVPLLLLVSRNKRKATSKKSRLPPSPSKLPFIGHLHLLGSLPHRSLRTLSEKHGPLMLLHLGQVPTLVVSSPQMAREVMRTHDLVFASRPSLKAIRVLLRGSDDLAFAPYGEYWRQVRKFCVMRLLSAKMVQSFQKVREEEVALMIAKILQSSSTSIGNSVNMSEILNSLASDVICKIVSGKFFGGEGRNQLLRLMVEENSSVIGEFHPSDCFPRLAWLDGLFAAKLNAKMKRNAERWDDVLEEVIENHAHDQLKDDGAQKNSTDFVDVLLSLQRDSNGEFQPTRQEIKSLIMDMFAAGTDTSSIVLEWSLAELVRNPKLMKKLQDEVRGLTAEKEMLREMDLHRMSYLKAVIKETLRLHPPLPLLLPRESTENCIVEGYEIPKKTRVMINVWAIGRDPKFWEAADEFRPERFIDNPVDFRGSDFQFIPFGAGRRICPGMNFAVSTIELALANLVHRFDWEVPVGMKNGDLDMDEAQGITTHKKHSLHLIAKLHAAL